MWKLIINLITINHYVTVLTIKEIESVPLFSRQNITVLTAKRCQYRYILVKNNGTDSNGTDLKVQTICFSSLTLHNLGQLIT